MIRKETEPQPCPGMSIVWRGLQNYNAVRRTEAEEGARNARRAEESETWC